MKKRVLRRAVEIYLLLLIASWIFQRNHSAPLPTSGNWREIPIEIPDDDRTREALLRYRKFSGTSDGTLNPALLIHGSPMASDCFDPLLQELPMNRTYLVPDLPGFGHSKYGFDDYSFDGHADALRQLLEAESLTSVHLVAYSQGAGSALKLLASNPEAVASLTLLSGIGVLEHELTGDYFLNQALYGAQLILFKLLDWGTPHFGLLNNCLLNTRYAENFYYSDMRPLRSIMESAEAPTLILHSPSDWLVPPTAALEHFRILPQSKLYWSRGGHMLLVSEPEWVSDRLTAFFADVETGVAPTRSRADQARLLEARKDMPAAKLEPWSTILWITVFALGLGTLFSEDLTCVIAGLLAARGFIPLFFAMAACFIGIWIGDMLLYAIGRFGGGKLLSIWPFGKLIASTTITSTRTWLERRGGLAIFISRFMPGTRLPLYLTAGLVRMDVFRMMFWLAFAGLLWAFPVVALVAYFGQGFSEWLIEKSQWMLPGILLLFVLSFFLSRLLAALMTVEGRRKLFADLQRIRRWEFWPNYVFYTPVVLALAVILIRRGKPLAFASCNPGIPHSGLLGESKSKILDHLKLSGCVPEYLLIPGESTNKMQAVRDWMNANALTFPLVVKPDRGERGKDVRILQNAEELEADLQMREDDTIVQRYVAGLEFGIFYLRHPDEVNGSVISLNRKIMTAVEGDGCSTLEELILNDSRAVLSYRYFFQQFKNQLLEIPEVGQHVVLARIGSHCRGSLFLNGADLITPELLAEIDRIAKHFDGFYLGRFDIRCPSEPDLKSGMNLSVIELNGVSSEQTHIYHPFTPLRTALKTVIQQWKEAHEIGLINIAHGVPLSTFREILKLLTK